MAYRRYRDMIKDIQVVQGELEGNFLALQDEIEKVAMQHYKRAPGLARDYLTAYSRRQAERTVERWRSLWKELFVRYLDGNVRDEHGKVTHPPYPKHWYRRIIEESGDKYKMIRIEGEPDPDEEKKKKKAESKGDSPGAKKCPPCVCPPCKCE